MCKHAGLDCLWYVCVVCVRLVSLGVYRDADVQLRWWPINHLLVPVLPEYIDNVVGSVLYNVLVGIVGVVTTCVRQAVGTFSPQHSSFGLYPRTSQLGAFGFDGKLLCGAASCHCCPATPS
jgi:hypothetical protein